ncbi:hypothetical protein JKF63_02151 [Porcisia hertigi]|uniref:Uncharacterized protein n=1 Tax=Porcisia hertigi TaxID=2761500 RepID=A0A836LCF5_9TRYP|nr:hypothetical protein JKF63_02151 [Porcisia hertigi]
MRWAQQVLPALLAPLLDALRRVVNGVFTVTPTGAGNTNNSNCNTQATGPGIGGAAPGGSCSGVDSGSSAPCCGTRSGVSPSVSASHLATDDAGRSLAAGNAPVENSGYPAFNPALRGVAFRPDMFEELLLSVNEQYVVQPYSGGERASEWQLLHKEARVMSRRRQRASTTGGSGADLGTGGNIWSSRSAGDTAPSGVPLSAGSSPRKRERGVNSSRFNGPNALWYSATEEESIHVEAQGLYPGWSLQCLQEMIGIPLVLRQACVDVDASFCGADMLRWLSPSIASVSSASYEPRCTARGAATGRPLPLPQACPLRAAVCGTTLELPLCLRSGTVEGALEYAPQQCEVLHYWGINKAELFASIQAQKPLEAIQAGSYGEVTREEVISMQKKAHEQAKKMSWTHGMRCPGAHLHARPTNTLAEVWYSLHVCVCLRVRGLLSGGMASLDRHEWPLP